MVSPPMQLNSYSPVSVDCDDASPPSPSSLSRRRSHRKPVLKRAASEAVPEEDTNKKKNKKKTLSSPVINRIWNEEDELTILKGLVDYQSKTGVQPKVDWNAFCHFIGDSINVKFAKDQILSKIRKLKRKFYLNLEKMNEGNDPNFTKCSDSEAFGYSMMIWGKNEHEFANGDLQKESGEELLTENQTAQEFDGQSHSHHEVVTEKVTENGNAGKENHDDELCAVKDAFETILSQGLSEYQKKLLLDKLINLGTRKIKELSDEWKALCAEEVKLHIKKLRFSTNLAEAANDI